MDTLFESMWLHACEQYISVHCRHRDVIIDRTLNGTYVVLEA